MSNPKKLMPIIRINGKQISGNLYEINEKSLTNLESLVKIVKKSASLGNMHIVDLISKKFGEGGVSIVALLMESHIAIHTWPESNYATIDIFTCGTESRPETSFRYIVKKLKPKRYSVFRPNKKMEFG